MEKFSFKSLFPISDLSVMAILPVLLRIRSLYKRINQVVEDILSKNPDIVILIDSPDFHQRVAKKLMKKSFKSKIVCYVAPTVWAWRQKRVKSMAKDFDHLLSILPFEDEFFSKNGLNTTYVGHPAIPLIKQSNEKIFRFKYKINDNPILIFLPGSRDSEIKRHVKPFKEAFSKIKENIPNLTLAIPINDKKKHLISPYFKDAIIITDEEEKLLLFKEADAACASSGTVTLELGLSLTPMVVIYKLDFITWAIVSRLARVKFVSLVNLVLNKSSVTELLQNKCSPRNITKSILELLTNHKTSSNQKKDLLEFKNVMEDGSMTPSKRAAKTIQEILKE